MKRKQWLLIVVLVVVACLAYAGLSAWRRPSAAEVSLESAQEIAVVERGTIRVTIDGSGSLAPDDEASMAFASGGEVVEVPVEVGDVVQAGDLLAQLDDAEARQAVEEAELEVAQAELNLALARAEAEAGIAEANLEAAQAAYDWAAGLAERTGDQLTAARVNLEQAQDELADAQEDYDQAWDEARDWELEIKWKKDALEAEREATEDALEWAQYNLEVAQADYNLAVADISDSDVQTAWVNVLNARVAVEGEPLELDQLEIALSQTRLGLQSARRALEDTALIAPIDGTITALDVHEGEMVTGGQTAVVVSDLDTFVVEISLDETDVAKVSVGQEAVVRLDAFPGMELAGRITDVAPVAESLSGVVLYPVTVELAAAEVPARAGMTADVEIVTASKADALIAPLRAVHSEDGGTYVWRQAGDGFQSVEVKLGVTNDTQVEISQGLSEGDVVSVASVPEGGEQNAAFGPIRFFGGDDDD